MEKETWPMVNSLNNKGYNNNNKSDDCMGIDRLSELPDDILLKILSYFSVMEATTTFGFISHRFNYLMRYFPNLIFDNLKAMERLFMNYDHKLLHHEASNFVRWGDWVMEQHLGDVIDEFKFKFDLGRNFQSSVNKWVGFALSKQVKSLAIDCRSPVTLEIGPLVAFQIHSCIREAVSMLSRRTDLRLKIPLRYLYLCNMNVRDESMRCLLRCPYLEHLHLFRIYFLKQITVSDTALSLKYFRVEYSFHTKTISLSSTKLETFKYSGKPIELNITNASSLSDVSIGSCVIHDTSIEYALDSLSPYYTQLEHLQLQMNLYTKKNLGTKRSLVLTKLKHLELDVYAKCHLNLLGWVPLIEACPVLQKLTLKVASGEYKPCKVKIIPGTGRPLKCLRTLEIVGFVGGHIDLELATHVLEHAVVLEEVIVDVGRWEMFFPVYEGAMEQAMTFKEKLPDNVKFIIKDDQDHNFYSFTW